MTDTPDVKRDATVSDTVERIRAERYPDIPRDLVLKIMSLHAGGDTDGLGRQIDDAIATWAKETL
jgi:hypothetical protein